MENENKEIVEKLEELRSDLVEGDKNQRYIGTVMYWLFAIILVTAKVTGYSTLSWFWTLIPILWPLYLMILIPMIFLCIFIGACLVVGGLEIYDYIDSKQYEKEKEKGLDE